MLKAQQPMFFFYLNSNRNAEERAAKTNCDTIKGFIITFLPSPHQKQILPFPILQILPNLPQPTSPWTFSIQVCLQRINMSGTQFTDIFLWKKRGAKPTRNLKMKGSKPTVIYNLHSKCLKSCMEATMVTLKWVRFTSKIILRSLSKGVFEWCTSTRSEVFSL